MRLGSQPIAGTARVNDKAGRARRVGLLMEYQKGG